jgi:hypothetical protein
MKEDDGRSVCICMHVVGMCVGACITSYFTAQHSTAQRHNFGVEKRKGIINQHKKEEEREDKEIDTHS